MIQASNAVATVRGNLPGAVTKFSKTTGKAAGSRISFMQEYPAGDIKKALREANPNLKGKLLTAEVDKVLRGDAAMPWVLLEATVSAARSNGFVPLVGDVNKAGDKLTLKFAKPTTTISADEAKQALKATMSPAELLAFCEATVAAAKEEAANKAALDDKKDEDSHSE